MPRYEGVPEGNPQLAHSVDRFNALLKAERLVERRRKELEGALGLLRPELLPLYFQMTEELRKASES